jgi:hypothetical protein
VHRIVFLLIGGIFLAGIGAAEPSGRKLGAYVSSLGTQVRSEFLEDKAVPRTDKNAAEFIGTVLEIDDIGFTECGDRALILWMRVTKPVNIPVPIVCAGDSMVNFCRSLRLSQRVRFQGFLSLLPENINEPGFDPCDINTWDDPAPGAFAFVPTKISR